MPHVRSKSTQVLHASNEAIVPRVRTTALQVATLVATSPEVSAAPAPVTGVTGSILEVTGERIRGEARAHVRLVDRSGRLRRCDAAEDGEYALQALALGTHWVTVSADGYQTQLTTIELSADRPRLRQDFTLQQAVELRVHVTTTDGRTVLDAEAIRHLAPVATREPLGARDDVTFGSALLAGRFEARGACTQALPPECVGILVMDGEEPAWVSLLHEALVVQSHRVVPGQDEVTFVIAPEDLLLRSSAVRVCVIDSLTGMPLHRARVRISGEASPVPDVLTDELGFATVEGAAPGRRELLVRVKTYAELRLPIDVQHAAVTDAGTVALEPEVTVAGRVLDGEGRPRAATFTLGIVDPTDRSLRWSSRASFQSSADGSFTIRGLGRHEYVLRSSDDDRGPGADWRGFASVSGNVVLDTRAGSLTGLEVPVRQASKLVLHTSTRTRGRLSFRVVDMHGLEAAAGSLHGCEPRALELPPGVYRVSSPSAGGTALADQTVELGSDVVTLDLALR